MIETAAKSGGTSQTFVELIERKADVYRKKNADYAGELGTYFNFIYAAQLSEPFQDPVDRVFATMIGIKLGRLAVLKRKGKKPNHESVADSHADLTTYVGIWEAYHKDEQEPK